MSLSTLNADEAMILMGMLREVVQADGAYTAEEAAEVAKIEAALGVERFQAAVQAARTEFTTRKALASKVNRVDPSRGAGGHPRHPHGGRRQRRGHRGRGPAHPLVGRRLGPLSSQSPTGARVGSMEPPVSRPS